MAWAPASFGCAVEAGQDGNGDGLARAAKTLEVVFLRHAIVGEVGQIAERFSEGVSAPGEILIEGTGLKRQLFLKERGEDDRGGAGILHVANIVDRL
jgi:hypothetical protein